MAFDEVARERLADLLDDEGRVIDEVVATFFAAPRSYTAEDVVEISCHGAPVVLRLHRPWYHDIAALRFRNIKVGVIWIIQHKEAVAEVHHAPVIIQYACGFARAARPRPSAVVLQAAV